MKIIKLENNENEIIKQSVEVLSQGQLLIYPTETCYGIGVDATNKDAIEKVLRYKTKRTDKPLSIAVCDKEMAEKYVVINSSAENLYNLFLPGPVTVVSKGKNIVADNVQSPTGTLGIRIPKYPLVLQIIKKFGGAITATSANASYKKTPYELKDIMENTSKKQQELIGLIIDAGKLPRRKPSVVVDTTLEDMHVIRSGSLKLENYQQKYIYSEKETREFITNIYQRIRTSIGKKLVVILLQGDLGTGKTFATRCLAQHLQIKENISSPTFILCREHKIPNTEGKLYHIDTYRMFSVEEMLDLKCEDMFKSPNVVVIEWADKVIDKIQSFLEQAIVVDVRLEHVSENKRKFVFAIL